MAYIPIVAVRNLNGVGFPAMDRLPQAAGKTYKMGVPLLLDGSGNLIEADFTNGAYLVVGFSSEPGQNLTVAGTAEPAYSEGAPINQSAAKIIPPGAWPRDGRGGLYLANSQSVFMGSVKSGQTMAQSYMLPATYYSINKDGTTGLWYIDLTDTSGNDAVVQLVDVVDGDTTKALFMVKAAQRFYA